ncbi:hypothetical protein MtrunA17_Chr2g0278531 [Medicago truncatula]|uniref:Thionin-like protein n=1 Tax=Medicago truncatula TaxID=3880 RepID=G7IL76_MEDTR|nr:Thionin-like protein [Medicago truncatula]AFK40421.1 unknown [Medicago truncatula]RHN71593.1 hypothetical protein MtrunA17_Chr2g0278531 [Medicago truncatula]
MMMMKMKMKKTVFAMMVLFVIFSQMDSVVPDAFDCLDGCQTGCVQRDSRLTARCERKCSIRCGPDSMFEKGMD